MANNVPRHNKRFFYYSYTTLIGHAIKGRRFDFRPFHCQATTLGNLFTHLFQVICLHRQAI